MAQKGSRSGKKHLLSKAAKKINKFRNAMASALTTAQINDDTWNDLLGTTMLLHRVALLKCQDTKSVIKRLEKQKKNEDELPKEDIEAKLQLANSLIAQWNHWEKIEGTLTRLRALCNNEDEILRGPFLPEPKTDAYPE